MLVPIHTMVSENAQKNLDSYRMSHRTKTGKQIGEGTALPEIREGLGD